MKIDHDYLKRLLDAFESSETPTTDLYELERKGIFYREDIFVFHM